MLFMYKIVIKNIYNFFSQKSLFSPSIKIAIDIFNIINMVLKFIFLRIEERRESMKYGMMI